MICELHILVDLIVRAANVIDRRQRWLVFKTVRLGSMASAILTIPLPVRQIRCQCLFQFKFLDRLSKLFRILQIKRVKQSLFHIYKNFGSSMQ